MSHSYITNCEYPSWVSDQNALSLFVSQFIFRRRRDCLLADDIRSGTDIYNVGVNWRKLKSNLYICSW
jgi:hypothetical protein